MTKKKQNTKKVCLISSSGGHYEQLSMLRKLEEKYSIFWVTEKTDYQSDADYYLPQTGSNDKWLLLKLAAMGVKTLGIWLKERPDAVITTGTLVAIPMCLLAKLLGKKVIYIESFARVRDCTRAGKLMYKFADLFIYQWEELQEFYPKGVFGGSIY